MIKEMIAEELAKPRPDEFKIFSGASHPVLAQKIAEELRSPLGKIDLKPFSNGEQYVALMESVRNKIVFMVQTCRDQHVAQDYDELYKMADAAMNADSGKRIAIIPYLGDSRQDKIHKKREPISPRVIANNLEANGYRGIITNLLHSPQIQGVFKIPVYNVMPHKMFADYFKKRLEGIGPDELMVVSTDAGGEKNAGSFAEELGLDNIKNVATILKKRPKPNQSTVTGVLGNVKNKTCIIYDDMIDTAGSVCNAKEALISMGANPEIYLCATHAIFSGKAIAKLKEANFKEVVVSDTLPLGPEKQFEGLIQLSVAPLIAEWMASIIGMPSPSSRKSDKSK